LNGASGEVLRLWLKRFKRGPMDPVLFAEAVAGRGLVGNKDQGGKRQVTIVDEARWNEACAELGTLVDPAARRANVLLRGIELEGMRGKRLRIGGCVIRIYNETRPCERMDEAQDGLRAALGPHWRAGAYGEVVAGGIIRLGDRAEWLDDES
jgi:MOSC domain-containing protein YiiM